MPILRSQISYNLLQPTPKNLCIHTRIGRDFVFDQCVERGIYIQFANSYPAHIPLL